MDAFYTRGRANPERHHTCCKSCAQYDEYVRRLIKLAHPRPMDSACQACGRVARLEADHDHATGFIDPVASFRSWLCHSCNEKAKTRPRLPSPSRLGEGLPPAVSAGM